MTFRDKLKKIQEAVKAGKGGAVFEYFYDYYKFEAFVIIAVLYFIGSLTYTKLTEKEIVLSGALLNQYNILAEDLVLDMGNEFLTEQGLDLKEKKAEFNTSLRYAHSGDSSFNDATIQGLVAQCSGGTLDFITGDMEAMTIFAYGEYIYDLREILTEEEMELFKPYILYVDLDYQRQVEAALITPEVIPTMVPPDMRYPEKMVEPIPVLIDLRDSALLSEIYIDLVDVLCFGFTVNSPNPDMTKEFLYYLMDM
ncbi:MAG: hypothetical protein IIV75_04720 [Lachnospiraceae bacterium]|nr:hypothetical protein [Lachnospiraceae bacterium]